MQEALEKIDDPEGFLLDPSLVLYLPLGKRDGSSFMSDDMYGHTCTVTGATWGPTGRYFDGSSKIVTSIFSEITEAGTYSFCAWVKPDAVAVSQTIFENVHSGTDRNAMTITANTLQIQYYNGAYTSKSGTITAAWAFCIGKNDGGTMYLTINDVNQTGGVTTSMYAAAAGFNLGSRGDDSVYYTGYMGEVLLYNRVLTVAEGTHIYQATKWRYQ